MTPLVDAATKQEDLSQIACIGVQAFDLSDIGIKAARKLNGISGSPENQVLLAYTLYDREADESVNVSFAKAGSEEEAAAKTAQKQFGTEASQQATQAERRAKGSSLLLAQFVIGSIRNEEGAYPEMVPMLTQVANAKLNVCGNDLTQSAYRQLIVASAESKQPEAAEKWFRRYAADYSPEAYEWDSEGDRRSAARDYRNAADAYEKAAENNYYAYDSCYAVSQNFGITGTEDAVLSDGRKCIDSSVRLRTKENQQHFDEQLPFVYREMASVLETRGVYQQALEYVKESLALKAEDPFALNTEADILEDLGRNSECIAAESAAIRDSDGKYAWMHFRLASCYFEAENWSQAATSFRLAADADKSDAAAAFNLGLSLSRQGFDADARQWFREALSRKPDDQTRAKILDALK